MTMYHHSETGLTYSGLLVTESTTAEDIAEFVDSDTEDIGGNHDGWFTVPDLLTSNTSYDVFEGHLILRHPNGDLDMAINPREWGEVG